MTEKINLYKIHNRSKIVYSYRVIVTMKLSVCNPLPEVTEWQYDHESTTSIWLSYVDLSKNAGKNYLLGRSLATTLMEKNLRKAEVQLYFLNTNFISMLLPSPFVSCNVMNLKSSFNCVWWKADWALQYIVLRCLNSMCRFRI